MLFDSNFSSRVSIGFFNLKHLFIQHYLTLLKWWLTPKSNMWCSKRQTIHFKNSSATSLYTNWLLTQDNQLDSATTPLIFTSHTVTWASGPWCLFPPAQCSVVNYIKVELFWSEFTWLLLSLVKGRSWLFVLLSCIFMYLYLQQLHFGPFINLI